jgi:serine/threonine-protein kinase RsbW
MFEDTVFTLRSYAVPPGCQILIHSDGASEITLEDGRQLSLKDFTSLAGRLAQSPHWSLDGLIDELRTLSQASFFEDDCSLIQLTFPRETPVEIDGRRDPLAAIQAALDAFWSTHPRVPDGVRMQMAIAIAEVGANIVEHTGRGRPLRIRMDAALVDDQVHVDFTDDGPPVAIDLAAVTMPDPMAERGRGLAMAQALLDRLAYRCEDTGNHWALVSKRFT